MRSDPDRKVQFHQQQTRPQGRNFQEQIFIRGIGQQRRAGIFRVFLCMRSANSGSLWGFRAWIEAREVVERELLTVKNSGMLMQYSWLVPSRRVPFRPKRA